MVDAPDSKLIQKIKKENPDLLFEDILKIAKSQKSNNKKPNSKGIDIDEAVGYGFDMFNGIAKYIIFILILNGIGFFIFLVGLDEESAMLFFGIPFIIAGIVLNIALSIGVMYKLWVDILERSRK